jgi:hypothetical protein
MTLQEFLKQLLDEIAEQKIPLMHTQILICQDGVMSFNLEKLEIIYDPDDGENRLCLNEEMK